MKESSPCQKNRWRPLHAQYGTHVRSLFEAPEPSVSIAQKGKYVVAFFFEL